MTNNIESIKKLREITGVGISKAKEALENTDWDLQKAIDLLRKEGEKVAAKKADREAREGLVETYIHGAGKLGVMLELNCETDFVAKNDDFKQLAHDLALHIAANNPQCIDVGEIPAEEIEKEIEIAKAQLEKEKKKPEMVEKIVNGKIDKWKQEIALLTQPYLKNDKITVKQRIEETIAKMGENIKVKRFVVYKMN